MTTMPPFVCPEHRLPLAETADALTCPRGDRVPVTQRIPRFVDTAGYAEAFGLRCLGVSPGVLRGKAILELGCGAGRFTEVLLEHGAHVTSVDLSHAVEANAENFPPGARHRIAQADVPFAPRQ